MTVTDHPAVAAYLERFDALAQALPPERRAELRSDLLEHLADAIPADADGVTVGHALARLGPPEDILAAELGPAPASPPPPRPSMVHEGLAVALLTAGSFIPLLGWVVGVVLLWTSKKWTPGEKLVGTVLVPGGAGTIVIVGGLGVIGSTQVCEGVAQEVQAGQPMPDPVVHCTGGPSQPQTAITTAVLVTAVLLSFLVPALLYRRAARRAKAA